MKLLETPWGTLELAFRQASEEPADEAVDPDEVMEWVSTMVSEGKYPDGVCDICGAAAVSPRADAAKPFRVSTPDSDIVVEADLCHRDLDIIIEHLPAEVTDPRPPATAGYDPDAIEDALIDAGDVPEGKSTVVKDPRDDS